MWSGKKLFIFCVMVFVLFVIAAPLYAAPKYTLKFNHVLAPNEPYHEGFLEWAKRVEERTNGEVKIEVFHSAQLGVEEDIIEQIRAGANIGQNTDSARLGNYVREISVMNAPYFASSLEEIEKLKDSPTIKGWLEKLENEFGLKVLSFMWVQGFRHFMTNKPIKSPDDLKGLRIRTPGAPIWQESVRALGATPVALSFGDMYSALQSKAIDGCELVYANIVGGNLYEVLKYASETGHILLINFEVTSAKWFNSLPPEYQQIIMEECDKAGLETSRKIMEQLEEQHKQTCIEKGMEIVTDIDMEAFIKAGDKAYEALNLMDAKKILFEEMGKTVE